jgi:hypothetical protein
MKRIILGVVSAAVLGLLAQGVVAGPGGARVQGGSRYVVGSPAGAYVHGGYRHSGHSGVRHGWYGGYWGPSVGIYYGGPGYWGGWPYAWGYGYGYGYGYPYSVPYTYSPVVVNATPVPQSYIQQDSEAAPAQSAPVPAYWYYCTQPAGYFPHVQGCSHSWMKVIPQAPGDTSAPRFAP